MFITVEENILSRRMSSQTTSSPIATGSGTSAAAVAAAAAVATANMETDDLVDPMNDFLPLLPENIKQELFEGTDKGTANPCDSAENKVGSVC